MKRFLFAIGIAIGLVGSASAQSCYSQAYGAPAAEPFALSASTQSYTVSVPVTVTVAAAPVAVAAPLPVAAPAPCQQSYGYAAPVAVPFAVAACPQVGFAYSHSVGFATRGVGVATHYGAVNQGFVGQRFGAVGGGGINITARDRRGTVINASGNNNVRIQRGLFGNIRGAFADSNRGVLGRISPF